MKTARNARYVRRGRLPSGLWRVSAHGDDSVADGTIVDAVENEGGPVEGSGAPPGAGEELIWRVTEADSAIARIDIGPAFVPQRPHLWFVWVDEPRAGPAATNLVAFGTDHFAAGTVVSRFGFAAAGVPNGEQAGAVRWYPHSGLVHQIFVAPAWRRRFVASTLLYTADAFHQANGWSGYVHADGRRTALGQLFAAGLRHPNRARALTEEMPAMDEAIDDEARRRALE